MLTKRMIIPSIVLLSFILFTTGCSSPDVKTSAPKVTDDVKSLFIDSEGVVKSRNSHDIILDFDAKIISVSVDEGQMVKKGDVLAGLDFNNYKIQIGDAEADLRVANLQLQKLLTDSNVGNMEISQLNKEIKDKKDKLNNLTDPDIVKIQKDLDQLSFTYNEDKKGFNSKLELYKSQVISENDYKEYENALTLKKMQLDKLKSSLESMKSQKREEINQLEDKLAQLQTSYSGSKNLDIKIQQEGIKKLKDTIEQMKNKLNKPYIKDDKIISDYDNAVVSNIKYKPGNIITPAESLLTLTDNDEVYIDASIPEEFIKDITIGAKTTIIPIFDNKKEYTGTVTKIGNIAVMKDSETVIPIEVKADNLDGLLKIGYNVDLKIEKAKK